MCLSFAVNAIVKQKQPWVSYFSHIFIPDKSASSCVKAHLLIHCHYSDLLC